jgi:hypothetical protein
MPPASPNAAQVYEHRDFQGATVALEEGSFTVEHLDGTIGNDVISSLQVADGYKVIVYTDADFTGRSKEFTADAPYVGDAFNDAISSLQVMKHDAAAPASEIGDPIDAKALQFGAEIGLRYKF